MTIPEKILAIMQDIKTEQDLSKLNDALIAQKLIAKSEYEIVKHQEHEDKQGTLWQIVTVSCQLTIINTESEEILVNGAFGTGIDSGDMAATKAQAEAHREAWKAALNIFGEDKPAVTPEIVVETPEDKMIMQIQTLWKCRWDPTQLPGWIEKRFGGRTMELLNIAELSVVKSELENYRG